MRTAESSNFVRDFLAVKEMPFSYLNEDKERCHESLLRGYQILRIAKLMLADGVPNKYVLGVIELLERADNEL